MPITSSRAGHLWDALSRAYAVLGCDEAAGGDEVFPDLLLERIVEPTSKADSLQVLEETGLASPSPVTCFCVSGCGPWLLGEALIYACAIRHALGEILLIIDIRVFKRLHFSVIGL